MLKQLFNIRSDVDMANPQALYLKLGKRHCSLAISDENEPFPGELLYFSGDDLDIETLFQQHTAFNRPFEKVVVCYDHPESTLVTAGTESKGGSALKILYGINGNSTVLTEPVKDYSLVNVYGVPRPTHEFLLRRFRRIRFYHVYTIGLNTLQPDTGAGTMLVDIRTDEFTLIVSQNNQVLIAQTFAYATPADMLYYLLRTCQQFKLSQQTVQLRISGLLDKESALYKELHQYFLDIEFRDSTWNIPGNPSHFFTALNDLTQCES